ncbi:MAG: DNA repair protein RecO [Lachnospiraceae bacterium]|nr:DNA repair protein RecO [Lachnospiraceae bacterium]
MQEFVVVTGIVLKTVPIGEYDRRVLILTKERGKIAAFAKGARRQNSRLMASTNLFVFGEFKLYEGKTSYNIMEANISNYFETLREDFEGAYYGMYFLEVMDYYTKENNDEVEMLKLLYQSLKALQSESLKNELIRYIFEVKSIVINGEFPGIPETDRAGRLMASTVYTIDYIVASTIEKLYTFTVTEEVLNELRMMASYYRKRCLDRNFKSLEILDML